MRFSAIEMIGVHVENERGKEGVIEARYWGGKKGGLAHDARMKYDLV